MNIVVISECLIIRKGIVSILSKEDIAGSIRESNNYKDIYKLENDLIIIDINKQSIKYLKDLSLLKYEYNIKAIVVDFYEDESIFLKCKELGIDGYVLINQDSENIVYAVKQIQNGNQYYSKAFIEMLISKNNYKDKDVKVLTKREKDVLKLIATGKNNLEIAKELYITENTVKKHTSNILSKLDLKSRVQITLYTYNNRIIDI